MQDVAQKKMSLEEMLECARMNKSSAGKIICQSIYQRKNLSWTIFQNGSQLFIYYSSTSILLPVLGSTQVKRVFKPNKTDVESYIRAKKFLDTKCKRILSYDWWRSYTNFGNDQRCFAFIVNLHYTTYKQGIIDLNNQAIKYFYIFS